MSYLAAPENAAISVRLRPHLVEARCNGEYVWPEEKPFQAHEPPAPVVIPPWMDWLINLSIAAVFGALGFAFYWLVVR